MSFDDKVALVTGAAGGIGRATALAFAREGAKIVVADINDVGGSETVRLAETTGVEALYVHADMTDQNQVRNMVEATVARFGRLDCAVNNAGHPSRRTNVVDCTDDEWNLVMTLNVTSVLWCMKYQIPIMLEHGGGSIVNVSSGAGLFASPSMAAYTASKHAVLGLSRSAAVDFGRQNIRVNVLHPGTTATEMMTATAESMLAKGMDIMPSLLERNPLGRLATTEEQAEAVLWLSSDRASYANGVSLVMDGGLAVLR